MNNDELKIDGSAEANYNVHNTRKESRTQYFCEEDEMKLNQNVKYQNYAGAETAKIQEQQNVQAVPTRLPPQLFQRPQVFWERFLPFRSLKVLLAENDDSTRHVVAALLQNCGYEVTSVANSQQAWGILEDMRNHIDLVLTEVLMPGLSGIGLLSKIKSHRARKRIPVIMMSSHDSMNIVFNCLSKGAVDYLVKPIRKNELKILWQHVWRKHCGPSSSGSESVTRMQGPTASRSVEDSNNGTGNKNEDEIGSPGLNRDGSNNGSGIQSSWTKKAAEVESPQPMYACDQPAHRTGCPCAQVDFSRPETLGSNWKPLTAVNKNERQHDLLGYAALRKAPSEVQINTTGVKNDKLTGINCGKDDEQRKKKELEPNSEKSSSDLANPIPVGIITNSTDTQKKGDTTEIMNCLSKVSDMQGKAVNDARDILSLELTLRRPEVVNSTEGSPPEWNFFRHSDFSAFSRYNLASSASQTPTGNVGSCSLLQYSQGAAKAKSMQNCQSHSNNIPPNQSSNRSSDYNMGSATVNAPTKPAAFGKKLLSKPAFNCLKPYSSAFNPVQNGLISSFQPMQSQVNAWATKDLFLSQPSGINHHNCYGDSCQNEMMSAAMQGGSSNVPGGVQFEGNHGSNGSGSGSNNRSNVQTSCSFGFNPMAKHIERNNEVGGRDGANLETEFADKQSLSLRDAAVSKFLQKRKDRCFEKKIRYQSRKKLAEQRPRARGQFVRKDAEERQDRDTPGQSDLNLDTI